MTFCWEPLGFGAKVSLSFSFRVLLAALFVCISRGTAVVLLLLGEAFYFVLGCAHTKAFWQSGFMFWLHHGMDEFTLLFWYTK